MKQSGVVFGTLLAVLLSASPATANNELESFKQLYYQNPRVLTPGEVIEAAKELNLPDKSASGFWGRKVIFVFVRASSDDQGSALELLSNNSAKPVVYPTKDKNRKYFFELNDFSPAEIGTTLKQLHIRAVGGTVKIKSFGVMFEDKK